MSYLIDKVIEDLHRVRKRMRRLETFALERAKREAGYVAAGFTRVALSAQKAQATILVEASKPGEVAELEGLTKRHEETVTRARGNAGADLAAQLARSRSEAKH